MNLRRTSSQNWRMAADQIVFPATLHVSFWLVDRENTTRTLGPGQEYDISFGHYIKCQEFEDDGFEEKGLLLCAGFISFDQKNWYYSIEWL